MTTRPLSLVQYVTGEVELSDFRTREEKVLYVRDETRTDLLEAANEFTREVEERTGWKSNEGGSKDEEGNTYFHFDRLLRSDEVVRFMDVYCYLTLCGVLVNLEFVYDPEHASEEEKDLFKRQKYGNNSYTINNVQKEFNPDWIGKYMVVVSEDEITEKLRGILGKPYPYHWIDTDRVPVIMKTMEYYRLPVDVVHRFIDGERIRIVDFDKANLDTDQFLEPSGKEEEYFWDRYHPDMELYETKLKGIVALPKEEECLVYEEEMRVLDERLKEQGYTFE